MKQRQIEIFHILMNNQAAEISMSSLWDNLHKQAKHDFKMGRS